VPARTSPLGMNALVVISRTEANQSAQLVDALAEALGGES
jgi:hypothetical protein